MRKNHHSFCEPVEESIKQIKKSNSIKLNNLELRTHKNYRSNDNLKKLTKATISSSLKSRA